MHIYPLLVIVAGLLSTSHGGVVNRTQTYNICSGSRYNNLSITPASDPFIIRSQGVGVDSYDNNMECSLVLRSGTEPMVLSLEFSEFYLEYNPMFGIDWLCVNGILFSGPTFNGASFNYILPGGRDFTVHFHTDASVPESGFQIYVTASPLAEGQTVDQATSRVSDIPVAQYHWISFENTTYYPGIPYSDGCAQYLPTATTSPSTDTDDDNEISTTTEEAPKPTEKAATPTEDPAILLEETTDGTTDNATIPASMPVIYNICDSYGPVLVNVGPNSDPFFIRSPNFGNGGLYSNNLDCALSFISGDEPLVLSFHASAFNLELNYDTLCVNGVRFTGSWFAERTSSFILPEHSTSTVRFLTDSSVTYTGFNIQVTVRRADNETVYQIVGIGSGPESVALVATTYHPGMAYSDRCLLPPQAAPDYGLSTTTDDTTTVETTQESDYNTSTSMPVIYNICDRPSPVLVSVGPNSDPFYIRSPNFGNGGLYSNNLNCILLLTTGNEPLVSSFYVSNFYLEPNYDTLCVNGVRFTGWWFAGGTSSFILPENSTSTVRFVTDYSVTYTGFNIQVTVRRADNQTVNQYVGIGSGPDSVAEVPTTYYPGMAYSDRCLLPPQPAGDYGLSTTTDDTTVESTTKESDDTTSTSTTETYDICSGSRYNNLSITPASDPFIIRSQGVVVANYDNNLDCSLVLQTGIEPLVLSFEFRTFTLEASSSCGWDSLCLSGILFCGSSFSGSRFNYILPGNREFTAHFRTDSSVTLSGFQIYVTTSPLAAGQTVNQPAGRGSDRSSIYFVATTYYPGIPYSDGCAQNPPRATTYPPIYPTGIAEISNSTVEALTPTYEAATPTLTPAYEAATPTLTPAYEAATPTEEQQYNTYNLSSSHQLTIYISTSTSPFLILSPNYGSGSYFDSHFSALVLRSREQPLVLYLDIKDFQVESETSCSYDSLCVGGATFCGDWLTGYRLQFILPEYSDFTVSFRTDGSRVYRGFKILVSQELATSQLVHQPRSGIFSSSSTLTYTYERYQPGYPYSDRCPRPSLMTPEYTEFSTPSSEGPLVCYSAAYVRELNQVLDQAIAGLNTAKRLLNQRK